MRKPYRRNLGAQTALESCNLGRMLQPPPPPYAAPDSALVHGAGGNKKLKWKAPAVLGRSWKEKLLPRLMFALVFCPGLLGLSPQVSHTDPKAIAEDGQRALAERRYADAERDFKQLLKLDNRSASVYSNLGVVYLRTGRLDLAIDALLKAKALAPGVPGIRLNLGLAYFRKNDFAVAATYFGEVLASDPSNRQARYLKGICNFMMDDFAAAIAAFEPLQAVEQNDLEYLFMLGTSYGMVKRTDDSVRVFQQLIEAGGDTPHLHLLLGKAYLALGQQDKAEVELKRANENAQLPFAHYYLGVLNRQQGRLDLASVEFEKEIDITPSNPSAYKELAEIRLEQSNVQGAVAILEKGVAANPDSPELLATLGRAYLEVPNQARAIIVLRKAIALDPKSGSYHYQLGRAYLKSGRHAEASAEMERARVLSTDASEAKMRAFSKDQATAVGTDVRH
jgi:tetratricopeptide (TPR) repeat protein